MSSENTEAGQEIVNAAIAALNRSDVDGFVSYVAPEVEWKAVEELHPFRDREAVRRYTEQWLDHWNRFSLQTEDFRDLANSWLITVHAVGQSRAGIAIDDRFYLQVAVRDGLIVRWREYSDLADAFSEFV